ncbi:hypothetical protein Ancab_024371 [Ancistrocladus abbreviatus]
MLSVKLVRSLILGETMNNPLLLSHRNHHFHDDEDFGDDDATENDDAHAHRDAAVERRRGRRRRNIRKTSLLLFLPTRELIKDTYRLASIARDIGMNLYPNASLSHIIFSWPSSPPLSHSSSSSSSSSCRPSFSSSVSTTISSSLLLSLPNDAVPLPFPSLSTASISLLRSFISLSKGLFKLVFLNCNTQLEFQPNEKFSTWDCSSLSLISRITGIRVEKMDDFSRILAAHGWTLFKTKDKSVSDCGGLNSYGRNSVYLFRKMDSNRVRARDANGDCRIRELRLPMLDFKNVPSRILQYILLMTDDIFYLA